MSLISGSAFGQATAVDTAKADTTVKPKIEASHQIELGFDMGCLAKNYLVTDRVGYEFLASWYHKNEIYWVAEGGWGNSTVAYPDLSYKTNSSFLRLGFDKMLLGRENLKDWGGMQMGLRLGAAHVSRADAQYTIVDSTWGTTSGAVSGKSFVPVWAEITAGVRVELIRGIITGWNIRGKFMLNGKSFNDLSPTYIAGFGQGDKNSSFDFNFYLLYALRWNRKQ